MMALHEGARCRIVRDRCDLVPPGGDRLVAQTPRLGAVAPALCEPSEGELDEVAHAAVSSSTRYCGKPCSRPSLRSIPASTRFSLLKPSRADTRARTAGGSREW